MKYLISENKAVPHLLALPFIYAVVVPVVLLDFCIEIYHRVAFPLYGLPLVNRGDYVRVDRQKLTYLDAVQKLNCMYCGYVNGALAYWARIAGDTETYWCGIRHEQEGDYAEPARHKNYPAHGDEAAFEAVYKTQDPSDRAEQTERA